MVETFAVRRVGRPAHSEMPLEKVRIERSRCVVRRRSIAEFSSLAHCWALVGAYPKKLSEGILMRFIVGDLVRAWGVDAMVGRLTMSCR